MRVQINTIQMAINPSDIAHFEWKAEDTKESMGSSSKIDHANISFNRADAFCALYVFNWMRDTLNLFRGIDRRIAGFKIECDGCLTHGLLGLSIEMTAHYKSKKILMDAITRLHKQGRAFNDYMEAKHSSYEGFSSSIPNSVAGLLKQADPTYMMACMLGFLVEKRTMGKTFENDWTEPCKFSDPMACPERMGFDSSEAAYSLIRFK